ncbi:MAG: MerR family transcriptional regulator [Planctomycetota bacterium]
MAELSERSGVSVPTIKYYLREGLLPAGRKHNKNLSLYGDDHLARLRLIELLKNALAIPLAEVRGVLDTLDQLSSSPPRRPALAVLDVAERLRRACEQSTDTKGSPLDRGDHAWLLARGLERAGDGAGSFHQTVAGLRDAAAARALDIDLSDLEPWIRATQRLAELEAERIAEVFDRDAPIGERLAMALELLSIDEPLVLALFRRARRNALERVLLRGD